MPLMPFKTEADLAKCLVEYLKEDGWDVYEEVAPRGGGRHRADIVAVKGEVVRVIECKLMMGFSVIAQAKGWVGHADEVFVAVPRKRGHWKKRQAADLANKTCHDLHIGVIEIDRKRTDFYPAKEWAKTSPKKRASLVKMLCPELQEFNATAGAAGGTFWTPFKGTCKRLLQVVEAHPSGITIKDAVEQTEHHYANPSSARRNIKHLAERGVIPGVALDMRGKTPYLIGETNAAQEDA